MTPELPEETATLSMTRRCLHGVAELLVAGPQKAAIDTVRLRFASGAIAPWQGELPRLTTSGLQTPAGTFPYEGSIAALGERAGIVPRTLTHVYAEGAGLGPEAEITVDTAQVRVVLGAFDVGVAALADLAPASEQVLWPEHFDLAIVLDEVNYGVAPGDARLPVPYAYVGPWVRRRGAFWNADFGAALPLTELGGAAEVADFFRQGAASAASDPRV